MNRGTGLRQLGLRLRDSILPDMIHKMNTRDVSRDGGGRRWRRESHSKKEKNTEKEG